VSRKPVGKKAEPSVGELEFIYSRLGKLSDAEVLAEMQEDTTFPLRTTGFIKRRRREFDAAKRVLREHIEREADPIVAKNREEHFEFLAKLAGALLGYSVDDVHDLSKYDASSGRHPLGSLTGDVSEMEEPLVNQEIWSNWVLRWEVYDVWDFECLDSHLKAEYPEVVAEGGLEGILYGDPYRLADILRIVVRRKTFKGTCPVCESW